MPGQPSKLPINFVSKTVSANFNLLCEGKKDTTQDEKDIVGTKGTKQGHWGQKGDNRDGWGVFFSFQIFSRVKSREGLPRVVSDFDPWHPASVDYYPFTIWMMDNWFAFAAMSFIYISSRLTTLKTLCWFSSWPNLSKWRVPSFLSFSPILWSLSTSRRYLKVE